MLINTVNTSTHDATAIPFADVSHDHSWHKQQKSSSTVCQKCGDTTLLQLCSNCIVDITLSFKWVQHDEPSQWRGWTTVVVIVVFTSTKAWITQTDGYRWWTVKLRWTYTQLWMHAGTRLMGKQPYAFTGSSLLDTKNWLTLWFNKSHKSWSPAPNQTVPSLQSFQTDITV